MPILDEVHENLLIIKLKEKVKKNLESAQNLNLIKILNVIDKIDNPNIDAIYKALSLPKCPPCTILGGMNSLYILLFCLILFLKIDGIEGLRRRNPSAVATTSPEKLLAPIPAPLYDILGRPDECELATYLFTNSNLDNLVEAICKDPPDNPTIARPFSSYWGETHTYGDNNMASYGDVITNAPALFTQIIIDYLEEFPLTIPVKQVAKIPINICIYNNGECNYPHTVTLLLNSDSIIDGRYGIMDPLHLVSDDKRLPFYLTDDFYYFLDTNIDVKYDSSNFFNVSTAAISELLSNSVNPDYKQNKNKVFNFLVEIPIKLPVVGSTLVKETINPEWFAALREASKAVYYCFTKNKEEKYKDCTKTCNSKLGSSKLGEFGGARSVKKSKKKRSRKTKRMRKKNKK